jgi:hypothetical protein
MSKNTIRELPEEKAPELSTEQDAEKPKRPTRKSKRLKRFLNVFGVFDRHQVVKLMPFILFVTVLILFYIANSYYAERLIRDINKTKNDLKERRAEFISTSSELMFRTKQSEVTKTIAPMDLKESVEPQKKVVIVSNQKKK